MNQVATTLIPGLRGLGQHSMPMVFQERSTKLVVMVMALFPLEKMKVFSAVGSAKNNYRLHIFMRFRKNANAETSAWKKSGGSCWGNFGT